MSTLLPDGKKIRCRTYQQAEQLRPIVQNLKQRLDACGEDTASEAPLNELKEALCAQNLPVAIKECYIGEIDNRLEVIDRALRTTLNKEYPTREKAKAAEQEYEEIKSNFFYGHPRKNAARFRAKIEAADFSDTIKEELLDELFQLENANEIKTAKALSTVSTIILLGIVISSYLFQLSGTAAFAEKDIIVFGTSLKVTDIQVVERLAFLDGLKNGLGVFGRCIGDVFVHGFLEYIGGFEYGLLGNVLWAVFGWMWLVAKQMIIVIPRYLVSLFTTFAQTASIGYYIGYVIGSAIPFAVSQLNFDEDNQTENVQRIKSWTVQKISLAVVIVLFVVGISVYFIKNNF